MILEEDRGSHHRLPVSEREHLVDQGSSDLIVPTESSKPVEQVENDPQSMGLGKTESGPRWKRCLLKLIYKRLPITDWLPKYKLNKDLLGDVTGGLTMGVMHVSEGMAYAPLTGLRPVNGLFSSLFPAMVYMFFGTSRHVSVGGFAVICLMVGSAIARVSPKIVDSLTNSTANESNLDLDLITYEINVRLAASLTLGVGIAQIIMGILQFSVLTSFLSDQVIGGFTTGAAVHVMTSQLDKALGAKIPPRDGPGKLFWVYADLINALFAGHFHRFTACLSVFLIFTLFTVKNFVDPHLRRALKISIPLPYDLVLMLLGTLFSRVFSLADQFGVSIIGDIPTGLPSASLPDIGLLRYLLVDSISIAMVILVIHISMGKLFAKKHNYELDVKQEFYASGLTECLCSLFPVYPPSTSMGRSLVGEAAGARTLLSAVFSSTLVLSVILFLGPILEPLPTCVLASIVIVSLQGMFRQVSQISDLWRTNKIDSIVFVVTLVGTVCVDIVPGLLIGIAFVLATVIARTQRSGLTRNGDSFESYQCPESLNEDQLTLRLSAPLIFLNVDEFWRSLRRILRKEGPMILPNVLHGNQQKEVPQRSLTVDCQMVTNIDSMGARALMEAFTYCQARGFSLHFCRVNENVHRILQKFPEFDAISESFCVLKY